jgi:hypothetical protein
LKVTRAFTAHIAVKAPGSPHRPGHSASRRERGYAIVHVAVRSAFDQPEASGGDLDQFVRIQGWMPLYEGGLGDISGTRGIALLGDAELKRALKWQAGSLMLHQSTHFAA